MPALENDQWEHFALMVARGGLSQQNAYLRAGFKGTKRTASANSNRLANRPEVKARIDELRANLAQKRGVTVDSLLDELDGMIRMATACNQPGAGVAAITTKARLTGLLVDRSEVETTVRRPMRKPSSEKEMTVEEWEAQFKPRGELQ